MNILFVSPYTPTPIRTRPYNLLRSLARLGHRLTLAALWERDEEQRALRELEGLGIRVLARRLTRARVVCNLPAAVLRGQPLQARYCWEPGLAHRVEQAVAGEQFDLAHVEHLRGVELGRAVQAAGHRHGRTLPVVWDSVDCITTLFERAAETSRSLFGRWITRLELPRTRDYEGQAVRRFDRVLATAQFDAAALGRLAVRAAQRRSAGGEPVLNPAGAVRWLPNGVDLEYFTPGASPRDPATVVLTGKMSYHANVTAAHVLLAEIMPRVWAERPDVRVNIIGSSPTPDIRALAERFAPRVTVSGYVADLRPYLQTATLAVAPVAYGAGIQNKVLEAMACEAPVVASPQAVAALAVRPEEQVLVAEGPAAGAAAIVRLIGDPALRARLGAAGRRYVAQHHDWNQVARQLQAIYHELVPPTRLPG
ncbi:MAG: glycosyltransferase [Anaerolineales bacterium]|nr:glycosyltransferase [Anaerolineales bacterium]